MMKNVFFAICCLGILCSWTSAPLTSVIGSEEAPHPLVLELIEHPVMQRMKEIDQSGPTPYFLELPSFRRYDHCLGVYMLLKRFHAPFDACIAGLLHDVSHTVFSHVADYPFRGQDRAHSYQDQIHLWYLKQHDLDITLSSYSLTLEDVDPDRFVILEQPLPELCADRLEYNLHTGYLWGVLSSEEIERILQDLCYEEGIWFFQSQKCARKFADLPLLFNTSLWGAAENLMIYHWISQALKRALEIGVLSLEEIHFSIDQQVLSRLQESEDPLIKQHLAFCVTPQDSYRLASAEDADIHLPIKFRGIDPWVQTDTGLQRLSAIDLEFAEQWRKVKAFAERGHAIKFLTH